MCLLLKAENVLRSSSGHYVLCDFGSAAGVTHTKVNIQQLQEEIARSDNIVISLKYLFAYQPACLLTTPSSYNP